MCSPENQANRPISAKQLLLQSQQKPVLSSNPVTTDQIVELLIAERDRLTRAIEVLQGPTKRRGRPQKNPAALATAAAAPNSRPSPGRKSMSKAARKAQSARMKKYWAAR